MQSGNAGVIRECDGHAALTERLLHALEYGGVEALLLLGRGLAAEKARNLRAVVPRLSVSGGDTALRRVWSNAEIDVGIHRAGG